MVKSPINYTTCKHSPRLPSQIKECCDSAELIGKSGKPKAAAAAAAPKKAAAPAASKPAAAKPAAAGGSKPAAVKKVKPSGSD